MKITTDQLREALTDEILAEIIGLSEEPHIHTVNAINIGDVVIFEIDEIIKLQDKDAVDNDHGMTVNDFLMPGHAA